MTSMDAPAASPATAPFPIRFTGDRRAYWRLLTRGAMLLMVTLGIYRFWLATDVRRFLWSSTEVAGDSLEYSGTAVELLIGFLFALAILVPIYLVFFLAALDIGPIGNMSGALGIALLFILGQYAIYCARRYRLSRTLYHGLRFHQQGNAVFYAVGASLWWALTALTLGLALPWMQAWRERYKMRHTYYGNVQGRFAGAGWRLFLRGLPLWLTVFLPFATGLVVLGGAYDPDTLQIVLRHIDDDDVMIRLAEINPDLFDAIGLAIVTTAISALLAALLYPVFQAIQLRWWLTGLRLGQMRMQSHLRTARVYGIYLRFVAYMALFIATLSLAAVPLLMIYGWLLRGNDVSILREAAAASLGLGIYVVAMLGFSTIYQATVMLSLWRRGVESLTLDGLGTLQQAAAAGRPSSAIGEGLADALQVGGL
ncbi:MAG TPA: DUF898 family protein [Pseudolabrys sp.]|nr:DUF898 family protein [Pseudolabrys sp.]